MNRLVFTQKNLEIKKQYIKFAEINCNMNIEIEVGKRYGKLVIVKEASRRYLPSGQPNRFVLCKCDCGTKKEIRLLHLVRYRTISCGCYRSPRKVSENPALRKVWRQMNNRCSESYFENHLYYKKGITVSDEWRNSFDLFCDWSLKNGYTKGLQLDREDNSKGYSKTNCRWVTSKVNNNNRDNTIFIDYKGEKKALMFILEDKLLISSMGAIRGRIKRGRNPEVAIDTPIKIGNYKRN